MTHYTENEYDIKADNIIGDISDDLNPDYTKIAKAIVYALLYIGDCILERELPEEEK